MKLSQLPMNTKVANEERISQRVDLYAAAYPGTPSAVRRPRLFHRSGTWIALLGDGAAQGIIGYGDTIEAALRKFDARYLADLRRPVESDPGPAELDDIYAAH